MILLSQYTLSGLVKNGNGEPLPYATVFLMKDNKSTVVAPVTSDNNGRFGLLLPDSINLSVVKFLYASYLKSKSALIPVIAGKKEYEIVIEAAHVLMSEITVESKTASLQRKADRFVFTPDRLLTEGGSALEIIKIAPLIQFDEKTSGFEIVNKPGTVVYINNRKSNLPREMIISLLRSTPAGNIRNIEIITNPGSEYDANTSGGVININLKRQFDEGWSAYFNVTTEQSVYNTAILNGAVNYRKNKIGIKISPFINNSFNYYTRTNQIEPVNNESQQINTKLYRRYFVAGGGLGIDYDISKRTLLSFNGFLSHVNGSTDQSNYTSYYNNNAFFDSVYFSPRKGKDNYTYNFGNVYFSHMLDSLGKKQLTINVDYNQFSQKNWDEGTFNKVGSSGTLSEISKYKNVLPQQFFNVSVRADYSSAINKQSKINFGVQVSNTDVSNDLSYNDWNYTTNNFKVNQDLTNNYKYTENYFGLYTSFTTQFTHKLNAVLGLRAERTSYATEEDRTKVKVDSNYTSLFPNLSLSYTINKNSNLSFALSKKIRRPNIELLFPGRRFYNARYFVENNPFLQPVIYYNGEAMYALLNKYFFSAGYSFYKNQYTNFIIPVVEDGQSKLKSTYLNYGNADNLYCSFFMQQKIKKYWEVNFSATINYATFKVKQEDATAGAGNVYNLNYSFSMNNTLYLSPKKKWTAFAWLKYNSPLENIAYDRKNALFSFDLGLKKVVNKVSVSLFITDIFYTNAKSTLVYQPNAAYLYNRLIQDNFTRSASLTIGYFLGNNKLRTNKNRNAANEEIKSRINK